MTTRLASVLLVTSLIGCGSSDNNTKTPDAAPMVPAHIMVMGTAKSAGLSSGPLAGVAISAYQNTDENTAVATATTDQSGNYTLDITTNGKALDGYIKATLTMYLDTYLYAPAPLTADYSGASMNLVNESTLETLSNLCGHAISNTPTPVGAVGMEAVDSSGAVVSGATFVATPAPAAYCYNGSTPGLPDKNATVTAADGLGYLINVSGDVAVTATKAGSTFGTHHIKVRPGALTTTLVQGQ